MKNFENVSADNTKQNQNKSVLENCDSTPDCSDTTNKTNEDCYLDSEKSEQDCCGPKESTSCCDDNSNEACCDSGDSSCCDGDKKTSAIIKEGIATIDGTEVEITSSDTNLVELAKKANITIPAPCYFSKRKGGCCKACVVEVNGKQNYACGTAPQKGMIITVNRPDLKELRRERILNYKEALKTGNPLSCNS